MRFYNTKELARMFHCDRRLFKVFRETNLLRFTKYGREYVYSEDDVADFVKLTKSVSLCSEQEIRTFAAYCRSKGKIK